MSISSEASRRLRPAGSYHVPPDAQPIGSWVDLLIEGAASMPEVVVRDIHREAEWRIAMALDGDHATARIRLPDVPTIVRYHFEFADGSILHELRQHEGRNTPIYGEWAQREFQIAVYDPK